MESAYGKSGDGGAARQHRLAGPTPAIAASLRVQANEAPAHGFSGGHLLLKGYQYQQTVDEIRSLFDACGLEGHGERRREFDTYSVVTALIPACRAMARPDTISTNELKVDQRKKVYVPGSERACVSEGHARTCPAYFEDWARSSTSIKQPAQVWPTGAYRIRPKAYPYATAPTGHHKCRG